MKYCKWIYTGFRMTRVSWKVVAVCVHHDTANIYLTDSEGDTRKIPMDSPDAHERLGARVEFDSLPPRARANIRCMSIGECESRFTQFLVDEARRTADSFCGTRSDGEA